MFNSYEPLLYQLPRFLVGVAVNLLTLWLLYRLIVWIFGGPQPSPHDSIKRWQGIVPTLDERPEDFYARFAARAKAKLDRPDLPLHKLRFGPRKLRATRILPYSLFSARPLYTMVSFRHFSYYVFAVAAPGGLFISSWAFSARTRMENDPFLMQKLQSLLRKETLFEYDVAALFSHFMHETLMEVVDEYTTERKLPPLTSTQRRPILGQAYSMPADLVNAAMLNVEASKSSGPLSATAQSIPDITQTAIPMHSSSPFDNDRLVGIGHERVVHDRVVQDSVRQEEAR